MYTLRADRLVLFTAITGDKSDFYGQSSQRMTFNY